MSTVSKITDYLHRRSGTDPINVKIDLLERKINDINIRLETTERFLVALQNPERREKDSIKKKNLFPDQLFTLEFNQLISLIDGLKEALSSESFDTLKNEFSDVLQIHEVFKAYLKDYRIANINDADNKLNICVDYRDKDFYLGISHFLYFIDKFKKKEIQELNNKIIELKNNLNSNQELKAA